MSRKRNKTVCIALIPLAATLAAAAESGPYQPNWKSLEHHTAAPEWFRDAKFGIYFHWGVYSVPAFGSEWYPRNMYNIHSKVYAHHVKTYGDPAKFGYEKFVPMFRAEKFDADAWAELFQKAGARFAGPVAEHHDGFAMWASRLTPWNAADMGPKRDVTGELARAIRRHGMRLITTFHTARNNLWKKNGKWHGHYQYVKQYFPQLLNDPKRNILFGYMPRQRFLEIWKGKLFEVIDAYRPDIIWFDSWLDEIPEQIRMEFLAYYFNQAEKWGREVMVTFKQQDLPQSVAVLDYEKGRADNLTDFVWLTDDTISRGSWCYTQGLRIKRADEVVDTLVDIVSKNGQLLLNISPKADGTIPADQRHVLLETGKWLDVNGEAIYGTRPFLVYGEGPRRLRKDGRRIRMVGRYDDRDIRYTRSKDGKTAYAVILDWPKKKDVPLTAVTVRKVSSDASIHLLGTPDPVEYRVDDSGTLHILPPPLPPDRRPCKYAYAFRLQGFQFSKKD